MSTPPRADLERELSSLRAEAEAARLAEFSDATLCRLALVPEWTVELAEQLGVAHRDVIDRLDAAGVIERRETLGAGGRRPEAFLMPAGGRPGPLQRLRETRGARMAEDLSDLTDLIAGQAPDDPGLRTWLEVVQSDRSDPSGRQLLSSVDRLLVADRFGEAAGLAATARVVGEVVGGTLGNAALRAPWRGARARPAAPSAP